VEDREHRRRMVAGMRNGRTWAAVKRRFGLARHDRGQRGAVLVEAAIVIPILMMITLGIIEYGGAYREDSTVATASRSGARTASALPKTDFGCVAGPTCFDSGITVAASVASTLQSLGATSPQQVWIYDVATKGSGPPNFTNCTNCVGYNWVSSSKSFNTTNKLGPGWLAVNQYTCAGTATPIDQIGIYVRATHTAVTRMFGGSKTLTGTTIMRFEPYVGAASCATG
jgi:Flp pilus assembly protein TadG